MGDGGRVEHPDTEGGVRRRGRTPSGAELQGCRRGVGALMSQTVVCDTCRSATPASQRPAVSSRWTCSATPWGRPASTTQPTSTTTSSSGLRDDLPGLDSCPRALRKGDVLVVWKPDRFGRNLAQPAASVFGIFAALAEFERTVAGLKAARARGRKGGRKPRPRWHTATRRCPHLSARLPPAGGPRRARAAESRGTRPPKTTKLCAGRGESTR